MMRSPPSLDEVGVCIFVDEVDEDDEDVEVGDVDEYVTCFLSVCCFPRVFGLLGMYF